MPEEAAAAAVVPTVIVDTPEQAAAKAITGAAEKPADKVAEKPAEAKPAERGRNGDAAKARIKAALEQKQMVERTATIEAENKSMREEMNALRPEAGKPRISLDAVAQEAKRTGRTQADVLKALIAEASGVAPDPAAALDPVKARIEKLEADLKASNEARDAEKEATKAAEIETAWRGEFRQHLVDNAEKYEHVSAERLSVVMRDAIEMITEMHVEYGYAANFDEVLEELDERYGKEERAKPKKPAAEAEKPAARAASVTLTNRDAATAPNLRDPKKMTESERHAWAAEAAKAALGQ